MNRVRTMLGVGICLFLGLGYFGSQSAVLFGDAARYSAAVDVPSVKLLSLVLLVAVLILGFLPKSEEPSE